MLKTYVTIFSLLLTICSLQGEEELFSVQPEESTFPEETTFAEQSIFSVGGAEGLYVGALGGVNLQTLEHNLFWTHLSPKTQGGFIVGGLVGYKFVNTDYSFFPIVSIEGEFSYRRNDLNRTFEWFGRSESLKGFIDHKSLLANLYVGFPIFPSTLIYPTNIYLGIGVGYSFTKIKVHNIPQKRNENGVVTQWIAGLSTEFWENNELAIEYRYFSSRENIQDHSITLNFRYFFDICY